MTLHIFNPEHDIALATNVARFTAPHAGRQLRADLGFLPALWAADGDMVLVDDVEAALEAVRHVRRLAADVVFVSPNDVKSLSLSVDVAPWGWDQGVAEQLRLMGFPAMVPPAEQLDAIRRLSSRQWAAEHLLPVLLNASQGLTGDARYVDSFDVLQHMMQANLTSEAEAGWGGAVLKAPWSSSGRGVRYVHNRDHWQHNAAWARNVIQRQGGIMLEPYYNKVKDFGMEFQALPDGRVEYCGLSVFQTVNGAYTGSVIATERAKREMLGRYIGMQLLDVVRDTICTTMSNALRGIYSGPFGVDMMIVADLQPRNVSTSPLDPQGCFRNEMEKELSTSQHFLLHPCVELNLRRTMGHVALSIACDDTMPQRLMRIDYTNRYHLRIIDTNENVLNGLIL